MTRPATGGWSSWRNHVRQTRHGDIGVQTHVGLRTFHPDTELLVRGSDRSNSIQENNLGITTHYDVGLTGDRQLYFMSLANTPH